MAHSVETKAKPKAADCPALLSSSTSSTTTSTTTNMINGQVNDSAFDIPLRDIQQKAIHLPERLTFDITWGGWSFSWVHAGTASLEMLATEKPSQWKILSRASCNGFFQSFYPVQDTIYSIIHKDGFYPLRFEKRLNEGKYHHSITALYNQANHSLWTQDTCLTIEPFTHDILSAFYFIRTQNLQVGHSFELNAVSGKKKYQLKVLCHRKESVKVPLGRFKTIVVEPVLVGDGLFKAKGKLTIWLTDDEAHIPVKMESQIPVGSIKAELTSRK